MRYRIPVIDHGPKPRVKKRGVREGVDEEPSRETCIHHWSECRCGRATALRFAAMGADLVLLANENKLQSLVSEIRKGGRAFIEL